MTGPDYPNLEVVVPGPEYPEVRNRSGVVIVWLAAVLVIVAFVLSVSAAASRGAPESPAPQKSAPSAAVGAEGLAQALLGTPQSETSALSPESRMLLAGSGVPPQADRYRGTATWYCLSGSSACTRGYSGNDLVAAIDTDLGFAKGDAVTVRYRGRFVTVTVVDTCGCPGERLIDLTSGAFSRLAPLGHGVIPVTVELAGPSSTLPATEIAP